MTVAAFHSAGMRPVDKLILSRKVNAGSSICIASLSNLLLISGIPLDLNVLMSLTSISNSLSLILLREKDGSGEWWLESSDIIDESDSVGQSGIGALGMSNYLAKLGQIVEKKSLICVDAFSGLMGCPAESCRTMPVSPFFLFNRLLISAQNFLGLLLALFIWAWMYSALEFWTALLASVLRDLASCKIAGRPVEYASRNLASLSAISSKM